MVDAVVVSDLHLVYDKTEVAAVRWLMENLRSDPPDELVLNGDIYELWRNDLAGNMWLTSKWTQTLVDLRDRGVDIVYLQGNHDDWLSRHTSEDRGYPFTQQLDYETVYSGVDFFFTHGHKYEPAYLPPTTDILSLADDRVGNLAGWLWGNRPAPNNPVENAALTLLGPAAGYLDPEDLRDNPTRRGFIERGIAADTRGGEWGVYGHTHDPFVDFSDRVANTGSMTAGQATYIEIESGKPRLRRAPMDERFHPENGQL